MKITYIKKKIINEKYVTDKKQLHNNQKQS